MMDATSSAVSIAVPSRDALHATAGCSAAAPPSRRAASAGSHGVDPMAPETSASHSSDVRYQRTVYGPGAAIVEPAIAFRKATAPVNVSARKNTQPIITTSIV